MNKQTETPHFFSEDGRKIEYRSISLMDLSEAEKGIEAEYRERGEPITVPTYTVETVSGAKVTKPLTADNLTVEGNEEETLRRHTEWSLYEQATNRMKAEIGAVTTEIILEAIVANVSDEDLNAWAEKKRNRHIRVPTDKEELLRYYKMSEILRTPSDLLKAQGKIMMLSSSGAVSEEAINAAEESFLRSLQEKAKRPAGEVANTAGNSGETTEKPLDTQQSAIGS